MQVNNMDLCLTQATENDIDGNKFVTEHPIKYQSGLFKGSQLNFALLTK